jgi:hypothetical protein
MRQNQNFRPGSRRRERWLATLDDYRVQYLVLDAYRDHRLLRAIRSRPEWTIDFEDGASVLLVRSQTRDAIQHTAQPCASANQGLGRTTDSQPSDPVLAAEHDVLAGQGQSSGVLSE